MGGREGGAGGCRCHHSPRLCVLSLRFYCFPCRCPITCFECQPLRIRPAPCCAIVSGVESILQDRGYDEIRYVIAISALFDSPSALLSTSSSVPHPTLLIDAAGEGSPAIRVTPEQYTPEMIRNDQEYRDGRHSCRCPWNNPKEAEQSFWGGYDPPTQSSRSESAHSRGTTLQQRSGANPLELLPKWVKKYFSPVLIRGKWWSFGKWEPVWHYSTRRGQG